MSTRKKRRSDDARDAAPRERMVAAAAELLGERGLAGASFTEVLERSGAARGSIYHHFPDGKDALAVEAMELVGDRVLALFRHRDGDTPSRVVRRVVDAWRAVLLESDCRAGCAIAAVAHERLVHPTLGARAAAIFDAWERALADTLAASGLAPAKASSAAALVLAALEGALILCRAHRDVGPLDAVGRALTAFVDPK